MHVLLRIRSYLPREFVLALTEAEASAVKGELAPSARFPSPTLFLIYVLYLGPKPAGLSLSLSLCPSLLYKYPLQPSFTYVHTNNCPSHVLVSPPPENILPIRAKPAIGTITLNIIASQPAYGCLTSSLEVMLRRRGRIFTSNASSIHAVPVSASPWHTHMTV